MSDTEAQAIIDEVTKHAEPALLTVGKDDDDRPVQVLVTNTEAGQQIYDITRLVDQFRERPRFRVGRTNLTDIDSFIAHVCNNSRLESIIFANRDLSNASLTAIYDYHQSTVTDDGEPGMCVDIATYSFPFSEEYRKWLEHNGKPMLQGQFAEFLEDRIIDIFPAEELTDSLTVFASKLGADYASPQEIMEVSRGLTLRAEQTVRQATKTSSGEVEIVFHEEHKSGSGEKLKVPNLFLIGIPIFDSGEGYRIPVRLRYRLTEGRVRWHYEIYQLERFVRDAIDEACRKVSSETGLSLLFGEHHGPSHRNDLTKVPNLNFLS